DRERFTVIPGEGRRFSNLKQAFVFYAVLVLAALLILIIGYHWLGDQFLAWRLQVAKAEIGFMEQKISGEGLIIRSEEVVRAPASGIILQLADPGRRVAAGAELAVVGVVDPADFDVLRGPEEIEPEADLWKRLIANWNQIFGNVFGNEAEIRSEYDEDISAFEKIIPINNENPGFLSYHLDGWEGYAGPVYLTQDTAAEKLPQMIVTEVGDLVEEGQPILKIVNNWHWYFNIVLPLNPGRAIAGQPDLTIIFDFAPDERAEAFIHDYIIDEVKQEVRITYRLRKQLEKFDQVRWSEASLIYRRHQGIIIPSGALFEKEGVAGVYVNQEGRVVFRPITVTMSQEEQLMVEGIQQHSLVIITHELVEEGQRLD
ncbi:MAG TPA: HlyD family efflux transporter periplasmic adaptor subunit, partial [Candidatus Limnocylindrales bacterium]|nr:HlyD family efflux transporter periplasmic adaptor subunit [Candidatus Limnocylindrales bacterium]